MCHIIPTPNGRKNNQKAIKFPAWSIARLSKIYPNWDFWFKNIPSGNPDRNEYWFLLWLAVTQNLKWHRRRFKTLCSRSVLWVSTWCSLFLLPKNIPFSWDHWRNRIQTDVAFSFIYIKPMLVALALYKEKHNLEHYIFSIIILCNWSISLDQFIVFDFSMFHYSLDTLFLFTPWGTFVEQSSTKVWTHHPSPQIWKWFYSTYLSATYTHTSTEVIKWPSPSSAYVSIACCTLSLSLFLLWT
jgi:hypothetical protein